MSVLVSECYLTCDVELYTDATHRKGRQQLHVVSECIRRVLNEFNHSIRQHRCDVTSINTFSINT